MHPDLKFILSYAKEHSLYTIINTSADNISPQQMRFITKNVDCALVSLQGYNAHSNEVYTKSPFPFSDKLHNIFALKSLLPSLRIGTVISPNVLTNIHKFATLIKKISPASWGLFRPMDASTTEELDILFYQKLISRILLIRQYNIHAQIANPLPMCITGNLHDGKNALLGALFDDGHLRIVRDINGFFKPSYFLDTNLGLTIESAWKNPLREKLNATTHCPRICQECPLLNECLGGSRAMAWHKHQSFTAPDPLFSLIQATQAVNTARLANTAPC